MNYLKIWSTNERSDYNIFEDICHILVSDLKESVTQLQHIWRYLSQIGVRVEGICHTIATYLKISVTDWLQMWRNLSHKYDIFEDICHRLASDLTESVTQLRHIWRYLSQIGGRSEGICYTSTTHLKISVFINSSQYKINTSFLIDTYTEYIISGRHRIHQKWLTYYSIDSV